MLSKDQSRILEFELCLSLLQLRKRTDLVRDIIPEKVVPTDLQKVLQELLTVIGSKETAISISETDRNMIRLLFSTTLMQLKVLLCKIECLNLEEMLGMEIDVERLEEVLAAIITLLSQNKAASRKRTRDEHFITSETRKSDIAEQATVPKRATEPNEPLIVTGKASMSMTKDMKASTSKDNSLQGEENDGKHATGNKKPATVSELADKKPAVYHEFCGKKPASGPELCDNEPGTGPELRDEELAVGTECHDQKRVSGDELSKNKSASDPELSDKKPAVGNEVQNKTCGPDPGLWDNKPAIGTELIRTELEATVNEQSYIQNASCQAMPADIWLSSNPITIENHEEVKQLQDETGIDKITGAEDTDVNVEETFEEEMDDDDDDDVKVVNMFPGITGKALNKQDDGLRLAPLSQVITKPMTNNTDNSMIDKTVPKQNEHHSHKRNYLEIKQAKATRQQKRKLPYQAPNRSDGKKCCRMKCMERTDFDDIQSTVINLSQDAKKELIKKFVTEKPCTRTSVNSRRSRNRKYHIPNGEGKEDEICKVTFMNLMGISSDFIDAVFRANRNKMSNNIITKEEEELEDEVAAVNLVHTENDSNIPTTVDESNFHLSDLNSDFNEKSREESRLMLKAYTHYDNHSGFGDLLSLKTMDYQEEGVLPIRRSHPEPVVYLTNVSNTGGSIIDNTPWETEQIHKTSTEILPSDTTSDIIAHANKAVLPDSIYESSTRPLLSHLEKKNANMVKLESRNKLESDLDSPSPLPFSVSSGTVLMASDLIPNDLPASPSVSSSYTSKNMYKRVYPGKPQAVVPPKKRPQPAHTTVGKCMHSINDSLSYVTAQHQYDQRVLTPELVTEIQKIFQTKVLHIKERQAESDVNIILQQIKNLHDMQEISIWCEFVNNPILEELIKQQCNLKKLVIERELFHRVQNFTYIAQGLADQAGTVEELDLSRCGFIGDQLKNVINTQRNLTKLNLTRCYLNPGEAKALPQGFSYTHEMLLLLELTGDNKKSVAGDVSKALINHHKLCKLDMSCCWMKPDDVKALCEGLSQIKGSLEELNLSNNNVGSVAGDVSKALINHHKMCKLDMSGCEMEPDDVKALCEGLRQMKGSLQELNLSKNNVGSAAGDASKALINHHKMCKLDMSGCEMEPDDVKALCEGLSQIKGSLQELNLSNNYVGSAAGDVSKALIKHHKLCKLDMSCCWMKPDDVKALCEGVSQMKGSLEELNLSNNNVGSAAGDASKTLIKHHKLCKLDMSACEMEPDDVKALCEGLSQMKGSLEELNLSNNNVGSAAGDASKTLIKHHKLCKLDMSECWMDPDDVKALCEGVSQMKGSLEELNLSNNNVGSAAGDASKTLIKHHKLCKLDMSACEMEPDDVKALCEGLSQMKGSLEELNLSNNNVGSAAGDVSKALINHHKLCKLDMSWRQMEPDDVIALCEGLSQMKGSLEELILMFNNTDNEDDIKQILMKKHTNLKIEW